jgi:putative membrane protein
VETLSLLLGTVWLRPYVFCFLFLYLLLAGSQIGWTRTVLWTVTGYGLAFAAEYGSIHWGFPFGDYYYIETTRNRELWVAGVPFMDSLSFTFLTYVGYSCAWQLVAAFRGSAQPLDGREYRRARGSGSVLILGALITTLMDVIIDPVALMGDRWFLGLIYGYGHEGHYFGIPVSNFAGWFLVSAVVIGVNQRLEPLLPEAEAGSYLSRLPFLHLGGFLLFLFVVGFNLAVTGWLGEGRLFLTGFSLVLLFLIVAGKILVRGGLLRPRFG